MIDYTKPDADSIVAEVRRAREAYAARFDNDLEALFASAKAAELLPNRIYRRAKPNERKIAADNPLLARNRHNG